MPEKVKVEICMGSSCFARGNNILLGTLENAIRVNGWGDAVALSGLRCENLCSSGPNIRIDGSLHQGLDAGALLDLLEKRLAAASRGGKPPSCGGC